MPAGKMSNFDESTALVLASEPEEEEYGPSLTEKLSSSAQSAIDKAREAGEAAKEVAKGGVSKGRQNTTGRRGKKMAASNQPDPMMQWVMQYLREEQTRISKLDADTREFVKGALENLRETTKEQRALNALIEETMTLISVTIQEERRRSQAKAWWEWIRDLSLILVGAVSCIRLGQVATAQQVLIGQLEPKRPHLSVARAA